ncbi:SDR family NAD(P)-dependent oxidoreductase [Paenibacillus chartarius]|uniref:SDR family NAD(P)-dependent oxidoreductase n=1 Tax=Paenibacillus chartarius TaxID=747481 RepID=A0ABV6DGP5_9BACL
MGTFYVITGASRGLGEALVRRVLREPGSRVLGVARSRSERLMEEAGTAGARLDWLEFDLASGDWNRLSGQLGERMEQVQAEGNVERWRLINNAGVLEPIGPAQDADLYAAELNIAVNLTAPMALTSAFLRLTEAYGGDRRILNISSGAGRKPYFGWSSYCAAKAGLDHFTRCLKLEQDALANGAKVVSAAPGVIDTAMQASIRAADVSRFRDKARFVQLHESGGLLSPDDAAERLLRLLEMPEFGDEPVVDIRDFS